MKSEKERRGPTLVNVARMAGVSVSTAARVLRNDEYPVDKSLQERVRAAAEEIGYVPNILARTLRGGGRRMVGLIVGDMMDPYYGAIAEAVTLHAEAAHSMVAMVCNTQRDPVLELKYCQLMWEHRVHGLILAGGGFDQWSHFDRLSTLVAQMTKAGVRVVTLSPRGLDVPAFCADNRASGECAAAHLLSLGHRRICVVMGPAQSEATQQRIAGITAALTRAGAGFKIIHTDYTSKAGETIAPSLIRSDPPFTALIAGADSTAVGIVNGLRAAGCSVPDDISVVGLGGTLMAGWISPRLTTVDMNLAASGRAALDYIALPEAELASWTMPDIGFDLSVGGTTRALQAG